MEHEDRLQIAAQNLERAVNDYIVEYGSKMLYDWVVEHGGDPETLEVISWDTETNVDGHPGVTIQRFTPKRIELKEEEK
ncbi:hypothetical protein BCP78_0123 [Bacillus phage BCP78]|uniref:Uncharacterized protein n=3 Tax=Tsarbombavirus BCP78 TaxID=1985182 RepID=J9PRL9_9CAUD|nr:hypothetical protein BCP78_0123 [Bacillus phage BCP78]YP_009783486.1 hypothetical protein QLX27_gp113 [Bacillus phage BCU4]AEW47130.1 hypothetical protein BCP78_0123 [Bacillus phage BCP78]AEW47619.1 hypothetical protein BCU4_0113 [Bacillus phage BCU4]AQN32502.1 hypothetical protein BCP12_084 [Bacillus phage BCP12]